MLMLGASGRDISLVDGGFDSRLCFTSEVLSVLAEATGRKLCALNPGWVPKQRSPVCSQPISL